MAIAEPASQTLTFLFTDIEGSTRLWERHPVAMRQALGRHDTILQDAVESSNGRVVKTTGDGVHAVFRSTADGVSACIKAQDGLLREPWGDTGSLQVRMALHTGEAAERAGDYYGPTLNRAARLMAAAHGGQVLLSAAAAALVIDQLPDGTTLRDLGEHHLKDLGRSERVFQLVRANLPATFPALVTVSRSSELPDQPTRFVGRDAELKEVRKQLADDAVRLLTLTGPGGIGKTRLALRAAADEKERFADGAVFVDLSSSQDSDSVVAAIARAVGLGTTKDEAPVDKLREWLHDEHVLLVLDNFEQVTAAAPMMARLLQECLGLKLLVTSREALHVRGEHLFVVPPLSLPTAALRKPSAEQVERFEAIQLFVERARAVKPDFVLTNDNAAAVADICIRLDGLPLAIELATARITIFSPEALRDRLGSRLELLRSGARDLPLRQQTLRGTIEWSYQLLDPGEQRLFDLLSAFSSASFEAIEAVAGAAGAAPGIDPVDGLASLVDKSLIRRDDLGDAQPRLRMLETIREYAAERLAQLREFKAATLRAHAAYYADFARQQWEELSGRRRDTARAALAADAENLRVAWHYWVGERDLDELNKLVDSLWFLYDARGRYNATIELTRQLLDVLASVPSTPERSTQEVTLRTSQARALMAIHGYTQEVEEAYARALEPFESGRELPQLFPVLRGLASFYTYRGEFANGARIGREILALAEAQNDASMRVDGHLVVGSSLAMQTDLRAGLEQLDKAIELFESEGSRSRRFRLGNNPGVASFLTSALVLWLLGFPDRALGRAHRALTLATRLEHPVTVAYALFHTAFLYLWRREPELCRDRAVALLDVADEYDLPIWRAIATFLVGAASVWMGRIDEGLADIREGLDRYQGLKTPPVFWPLILLVRGSACLRSGRPADGISMIDEALEVAGKGSGLTLLPSFYLLKGELLLALKSHAEADLWLELAFNRAGELDAKMPQLQAAIALFRSRPDAAGRKAALRRLREVYSTFSEGFAVPDLMEANELLAARAVAR